MTALFPDVVERDSLDFNRTPAWCVKLVVPYLGQPQTILDAGCGDGAIGKVLRMAFPLADIRGAELNSGRAFEASESCGSVDICTYNTVYEGDWLTPSTSPSWNDLLLFTPDLIISNPPFGLLALDFLRYAVARVRPGGTVAFLLPTHWDQDVDASCGDPLPAPKKGKPAPRYSEEQIERSKREKFARQRFLDSIRLRDGREGYAKFAIVGGGPNPARPSFRGGSDSASDRYAWFMFGEKWAGQPSRRLHAIPPAAESPQLRLI